MKTVIKNKTTNSAKDNLILLCDHNNDLSQFNFSKEELSYINKKRKKKKTKINALRIVE